MPETTTKQGREIFVDAPGFEDGAGLQWADFVSALQTWTFCRMTQDSSPTVREASDAFNVKEGVVIDAVGQAPWMFIAGMSDDYTKMTIELDGD